MRLITWFKSQRRGTRQFIALCIVPLVAIMIAGETVTLFAGSSTGAVVHMTLTSLWMIVLFVYIVFFDSKRRWPNKGASDRLVNLVTFKR